MEEKKVIRFVGEINQQSVNLLMNVVSDLVNKGYKDILLLLSSQGGSVMHGITLYNFLMQLPINLDTCNLGVIDSIAVVVYCAGKKRYCVPNSRFLIHGITLNFQNNVGLEEKKMKELLSGMQSDRTNMSKIISLSCDKPQEEIEQIMFNGVTYNAKQAKHLGLVTEIKEKLFEDNEKINIIGIS